jgi:hypothetical protein
MDLGFKNGLASTALTYNSRVLFSIAGVQISLFALFAFLMFMFSSFGDNSQG